MPKYRMYLFSTGDIEVTSVFSPTLNFMPGRGLQYAISLDDLPPHMVTLVPENYNAQNRNSDREKSISDNARLSRNRHNISHPGYHTLKIWMVDQGVVLQKIYGDTGGVRPSYLGPWESFFNLPKSK